LAALLELVALVAVVQAPTLELMPLALELLERQTLAVGVAALIVKETHPLAQMAAQALSSFLHPKQPHPPLDRLQSPQAVAGQSTGLQAQAQLHSEEQHGTFCTSRKRHRHTSNCG